MKHLPLAIVFALAAVACTTEPQEPAIINADGNHAIVNFQVRAPGMTRNAATRDYPVGYEDNINDVSLFLGHDNGAGFVVDSMITVQEYKAVDERTQSFSIPLPLSDAPTKIYVLTNMLSMPEGTPMTPESFQSNFPDGVDEEGFYSAFEGPSYWGFDNDDNGEVVMLMSGSAVLPTVTKRDINLHIPLLRWMARADVNVDLGADSLPFVPVSIDYYHGLQSARMFPDNAAYDPANASRVIAPSPSTSGNTYNTATRFPVQTLGTQTGLFATTYIPEYEAQTTAQSKLDAPCLILGGYFDGSSTLSYYRIDFDSQIDGHPFGQVLRNWKYVFNVTKIMSAGYDTPDEAAANPAHSIVLEVAIWDENVQQINFVGTGDYMYINTLEVDMNYNQSAQGTFVVRSTLPFDWGFSDPGTEPSTSDAAIDDTKFSVSITDRQVNTEYTDYTFTVTTLTENDSNARNDAGIFITANDAVISVKLSQRAEAVSQRIINVLSLTDNIGTQGIYFVNGKNNTGQTPLRTILNDPKWFGPTGTVKCGGFTFDRFQTGNILSSSTVSLPELQRALDATDILVTNYESDPPQAVVDMILNWSQKPYHVLFVAADGGGTTPVYGSNTNVLLRQTMQSSPVYDSRLAWYAMTSIVPGNSQTTNNAVLNSALGSDYLLAASKAGGYSPQSGEPLSVSAKSISVVDQTPENLIFTGGPFGMPESVPSTVNSYRIWDDISELAVPSAGSPVMPLLVLNANVFGWNNSSTPVVAKTDAMMIGVDIEHTVVYMGEGQQMVDYLFTAPPAGATVGIAQSPYYSSQSMLISNIWAWAVGNVLAQVKED